MREEILTVLWHGEPVGTLSYDGVLYQFEYLPDVVVSLPGLPRQSSRYSCGELFPLFAQRLMSRRRPDRPAWLKSLGLNEDATEMQILAASRGRRVGDYIELQPLR